MKRGTIEHPKTVMLQMLLGCSRLEAVGILEALFHWQRADASLRRKYETIFV